MKILLDTNVVLDVLLRRKPFDAVAVGIFALAEKRWFEGFLGGTTFTNVYYIARKHAGDAAARGYLRSLLGIFTVATVDREVVARAVDSGLRDFEDAVLRESGAGAGADGIVTRNPADFEGLAGMPVYSPDEFLAMIRGLEVGDHPKSGDRSP